MTSLRALVLIPLALPGCLFVNSFDDVLQDPVASGGGGNGSGGEGGTGGGSGGSDVDGGGGTGGGGSGGASGSGGQGSGGDAGPDAPPPFNPGGPNGAVVLYSDGAIRVLDPANGDQKIEETFGTIDFIAHDPISEHWYLFERTGTPIEPGTLHVRQLDTEHWSWREVSTLTPIALPADGKRIAVLNQRIAYLAPGAALTLTVLDTSDPANVEIVAEDIALPAGNKYGLLAQPETGTRVGGRANLVSNANCANEVCDVNLLAIQVSDSQVILGDDDLSDAIPNTVKVGDIPLTASNPGFTDDVLNHTSVITIPPLAPPSDAGPAAWETGCKDGQPPFTEGAVTKYSPVDQSQFAAPVPFVIRSSLIAGSAHSPCGNVTYVSTLFNDNGIFAIPATGAGTPSRICLSGPGGPLLYEPFTNTLFLAAQAGLTAYTNTGTATAPVLEPRQLQQLPSGLPVGVAVAVRQGPANCGN